MLGVTQRLTHLVNVFPARVTPLHYFNGCRIVQIGVRIRNQRCTPVVVFDPDNLVARLKYPDKIKSLDDVARRGGRSQSSHT